MAVRPTRKRILSEFLGSMNLAISLLLTVAVASIIGTVVDETKSYPEHLSDFGPFWFEVFRILGVYDVYSTPWFVFILAFLLVSTAVCLVRNTPSMLREWRSWRANVTWKSLRYGRHSDRWQVADSPDSSAQTVRDALRQSGYSTRTDHGGEHVVVTGRRGRWNRLGYICTHAAIVIIAVGGLIDSKVGMKIAHFAGAVEIETRNLRASQVPEESWLPEWNHASRGSVQIPEGSASDVSFVRLYDGYLVQPLPFTIELLDFEIERYPTGQPRSYESRVRVHDPELEQPFETTISVNHPLQHRGYSVYQSDFADGGSQLDLTGIALDGSGERLDIEGRVNDTTEMPGGTENRIQFDDFNLFNVNQVADAEGNIGQRNFGPSFDYTLIEPDGSRREYRNFMVPVQRDGNDFFLSGTRGAPDEEFEYLYIPADDRGSMERFLTLLEHTTEEERVQAAAEDAVADAVAGSELDTAQGRQQLVDTVGRLIGEFRREGFDGVITDVEDRVPAERQEQVLQAYLRVLQAVLASLYEDILAAEGISDPGPEERAFFRSALTAINGLSDYGSDYLLRLDGFNHVQASGLQIARAPGQPIVYSGAIILIIGLFLMFYVDHRRVWIWLSANGEGTDILLAGRSARDTLDFAPHFSDLAQRLRRASGATTEDSS